MVDLDTALSEQLLDTTMGQPEAQVSADSDDDDIGQEPESGEGRAWRDRRPRAVSDSHDGSHRTRHTDVPRFVEADLAFHHTLFEAVDNVFLNALFEPLSLVLRSLREETSSVPQIRERAIEWHARILDKVKSGDVEAAREMMRGHLMQIEGDTDHFLEDRQVTHASLG